MDNKYCPFLIRMMGKQEMKPEIIRFSHIRNHPEKTYLKKMGESRFKDRFKGFTKETTFMKKEGYIIVKIEPIEGTPAQDFRNKIEEANLVGLEF